MARKQLRIGGPPNWVEYMVYVLGFSLIILLALSMGRAQAQEENKTLQGWGCAWFPYVEKDEWNTQFIDRVTETVRIGWDTNDDGFEDVVHKYVIDAIGSSGLSNSVVIPHDTPSTVWFDLDFDHWVDVKLVDTTGKGLCESWRSVALPPKQANPNRIDPTFDKKDKA